MAKTKSRKKEAKAPPAAKSEGMRVIHLLSDSTGNLARHMLTAFLTQFPPQAFAVRAKTFLQDEAKLRAALDAIAADPGIVFHAMVSDQAKEAVLERCGKLGLPVRDLTGDFVGFLARESGLKPSQDYRKLHHVDEVYQRRIKAIEFAIVHDDGLGLETIREADLVLCGVSRTSKTPTTMYLAQQGYMVGNISLAMGVEPPREMLELPRGKVVGLVIDPVQLSQIRTRRQAEWRMGDTRYNDLEAVIDEVKWSRRLFLRQGWPILDVTNQAIEESAAKILNLLGIAHISG
jgi:regulator of PEP synthase PpsR (kinase-PPPase family)